MALPLHFSAIVSFHLPLCISLLGQHVWELCLALVELRPVGRSGGFKNYQQNSERILTDWALPETRPNTRQVSRSRLQRHMAGSDQPSTLSERPSKASLAREGVDSDTTISILYSLFQRWNQLISSPPANSDLSGPNPTSPRGYNHPLFLPLRKARDGNSRLG